MGDTQLVSFVPGKRVWLFIQVLMAVTVSRSSSGVLDIVNVLAIAVVVSCVSCVSEPAQSREKQHCCWKCKEEEECWIEVALHPLDMWHSDL